MNLGKSFLDELARDGALARHQIESYNDFVTRRLQGIIDEIGKIPIELPTGEELYIKLGKVMVGEPQVREPGGNIEPILPHEARLRNITYAAPVFVEMTHIFEDVEYNTETVEIGEIPVMVKSVLCPLSKMSREELIRVGEDPDDPGGYFIINGTERVVVISEEVAPNRLILQKKKGEYFIRINSERRGFVQKHIFERQKDGIITTRLTGVQQPIPLIAVIKALGMDSDKDIIEAINAEEDELEDVYLNIYGVEVYGKDDAVDYLGRKMKITQKEQRPERVYHLLDNYFLPHLGTTPASRLIKARYLAMVMRKLIKLRRGKIEPDDIDHYANKRLRMVGELMEMLVRSVILGRWGLIARLQYNYQKMMKRGRKLLKLQSTVVSEVFTKQIMRAMATGNWVGGRTGVSQRLERSNFIRSVAHLRSVVSPLSSAQEHFEARELHPTQWGRICAIRTPEGQNIGLRKFLAIAAEVTTEATEVENTKIISTLNALGVNEKDIVGTEVYLNGNFIGYHPDGKKLAEMLREKRRKGVITRKMNVAYYADRNEVVINTDVGRARRPLIVVEKGKSKLTDELKEKLLKGEITWKDLVEKGIVEYLDAEEEENAYVALREEDLTEEHTHLEIDPLFILGVDASLLVLAEKDRGDRLNYGTRMIVQSLGLYMKNYLIRTDTSAYLLAYPQLPIIASDASKFAGLEEHPTGQNLVIAVMPFEGYNMEDALIVNKASIERGMGRSYFYRTYITEATRYWGGQEDEIRIPDPTVRGFKGDFAYRHLDEDGIVPPETEVKGNDVLVGKISPIRFLGVLKEVRMGIKAVRDNSETVNPREDGIVDKVVVTENDEGDRLVKVTVREPKMPEIGDKFATRHGQKGVIGLIVPEQDMPFTKDGITPDIIINAHAIPSRMTVGQLLEIIGGKAAALAGERVNGTVFKSNEDMIIKALENAGFRYDGKEVLYDGVTGKKYGAHILVGVGHYFRLYHIASHKIHARARGPVTLLTKQPTEGRSREGGLRFGEMEKDCLIAHGAAITLKERFSSDRTKIYVCKDCGSIAMFDYIKGRPICQLCKSENVEEAEVSYAFKLLLDELRAMHINPRLKVGEEEE